MRILIALVVLVSIGCAKPAPLPVVMPEPVPAPVVQPVEEPRKPRIAKHRTERQERINRYDEQGFRVCQYNMQSTIGRIDPNYDSFTDCWNGHDWYHAQAQRLVMHEDRDIEQGCTRSADDQVTHLCEILSTDGYRQIVEKCKELASIGELTDATRAVLCIEDTQRQLLQRANDGQCPPHATNLFRAFSQGRSFRRVFLKRMASMGRPTARATACVRVGSRPRLGSRSQIRKWSGVSDWPSGRTMCFAAFASEPY